MELSDNQLHKILLFFVKLSKHCLRFYETQWQWKQLALRLVSSLLPQIWYPGWPKRQSALISFDSTLFSIWKSLKSADFWRIQNDKFGLAFHFSSKFPKIPQFWGTYFRFSPQFTKRIEQQKLFNQFSDVPKKLAFSFTAQVSKMIW